MAADLEQRAAAVTRRTAASRTDVWDVLADGWLYPLWVVGASRMRAVDTGWPAVGTQLHHSVGGWPLLLDDSTEVLDVQPLQEIRLRARAWPSGAAEVLLRIEDDGSGAVVTIWEDASHGPGTLVPRVARQAGIVPRNREGLRRLTLLAEGR